jgi:YegS/Rv2252/BmrU family lipid kinase
LSFVRHGDDMQPHHKDRLLGKLSDSDLIPLIIVFNPVAGPRRTQLLWRVLDLLIANGIRVELVKTTDAGHAQKLAHAAATAGTELVVAAGGDGTIAEVANGLIGSHARLGVIPLGTANVLAHELGLPFSANALAAALAFRRTRLIWPGLARGIGPCGGERSRLFVQMLSVGFDAHVVHRLPVRLKRTCGRGAYVAQTLRELGRYRFRPIRVRLDGAETQAASVIVSKGRLYAGRYLLAPDARPGEPGFSVVLFDHSGPSAALMYGAALPLDLLAKAPGLRRIRARRIEFLSDHVVPAQSDGDAVAVVPVAVTDAPRPIEIVVAA